MKLLRNLRRVIFKNRLLTLIVILAALLRFIGTTPGYPPIHTDEGISHSQGIAMVLERSLDPKHGYGLPYNYPIIVPLVNALFYLFLFIPLYSFLYIFSHLSEITNLLASQDFERLYNIIIQNILGPQRINVVFWGRVVTAFFGTGIVLLGYLTAKQLFNSKTIGLLSAFFIAINYRQVLNSHIGIPDIYNAFFLLFAFYQIIRLWEKQSLPRYLWVGVSVSLFFSTKFQFFALPPLLLTLIFLAALKKEFSKKLRFFLQKNIFLMFLVMVFSAVLLNIFHIINLQETLQQVSDSALKYRYGKSSLDFYPLSYLYHIGIGPLMSISATLGIILGLVFNFRKMLLLLSVIIPFMWMFVYYTGGGFYTRNFVTIIPLFLICAAFGIYTIFSKLTRVSRLFSFVFGGVFIAVIAFESLSNSLIVPIEYSKQWNYKLMQQWVGKNIPEGDTVLSSPGVQIPSKGFKIIETENPDDFSLVKMREDNIQWAIINTELVGINFLWWMNQDSATSLKFWNKPTDILSDDPLAGALLTLKSYIVFEALNPWQAPDNNFLVVKISEQPSNFNSKFDLNEHLFLNSNGGM